MQALPGGDISKTMKGTGFSPSLRRSYGRAYGYLSRSFSMLDELREDSDEKLFLSSR